jgi:hypothetical protein
METSSRSIRIHALHHHRRLSGGGAVARSPLGCQPITREHLLTKLLPCSLAGLKLRLVRNAYTPIHSLFDRNHHRHLFSPRKQKP